MIRPIGPLRRGELLDAEAAALCRGGDAGPTSTSAVDRTAGGAPGAPSTPQAGRLEAVGVSTPPGGRHPGVVDEHADAARPGR